MRTAQNRSFWVRVVSFVLVLALLPFGAIGEAVDTTDPEITKAYNNMMTALSLLEEANAALAKADADAAATLAAKEEAQQAVDNAQATVDAAKVAMDAAGVTEDSDIAKEIGALTARKAELQGKIDGAPVAKKAEITANDLLIEGQKLAVSNQQKKATEANNAVTEQEAAIAKTEDSLAHVSDELDNLNARIAVAEQESASKGHAIDLAQEKIAAAQSKLDNYEENIAKLEEGVTNAESALEAFKTQEAELDKQQKLLEKEEEQLLKDQATLADKESALAGQQAVLATKQQELAEAKATLDTEKAELDKSAQDQQSSQDTLNWANEQLPKLLDASNSAAAKAAEEQGKVDAKQAEINAVQANIDAENAKITAAQKAIDDKQAEIEGVAADIVAKQAQIDLAQNAIDDAIASSETDAEVVALKAQIAEKNAAIAEKDAAIAAASTELETKAGEKNTLTTGIADQQTIINEQTQIRDDNNENLPAARADEAAKLEAYNKASGFGKVTAWAKYEAAQLVVRGLEEAVKNAQGKIDAAVTQKQALESELAAVNARIAELNTTVTTLTNEKATLNSEKDALEDAVAEATDTSELTAAKQKLENEKAALEASKAAKEAEKLQLIDNKAAVVNAATPVIENLNDQKGDLETEKWWLEKSRDLAASTASIELSAYNKGLESAANAQTALDAANADLVQKQADWDAANAAWNTANNAVIEQMNDVAAAQKAVDDQQAANDALAADIANQKNLVAEELAKLNALMQNGNPDELKAAAEAALAAAKANAAADVAAWNQTIATETANKETLQSQKDAKDAEIAAMKEQLPALEATKAANSEALNSKLAEQKAELETRKAAAAAAQTKLADEQNKLAELNATKTRLENELADIDNSQDVLAWKAEMAAIDEQIASFDGEAKLLADYNEAKAALAAAKTKFDTVKLAYDAAAAWQKTCGLAQVAAKLAYDEAYSKYMQLIGSTNCAHDDFKVEIFSQTFCPLKLINVCTHNSGSCCTTLDVNQLTADVQATLEAGDFDALANEVKSLFEQTKRIVAAYEELPETLRDVIEAAVKSIINKAVNELGEKLLGEEKWAQFADLAEKLMDPEEAQKLMDQVKAAMIAKLKGEIEAAIGAEKFDKIEPAIDVTLAKLEEIVKEYDLFNLTEEDVKNIAKETLSQYKDQLIAQFKADIAEAIGDENYEKIEPLLNAAISKIDEINNKYDLFDLTREDLESIVADVMNDVKAQLIEDVKAAVKKAMETEEYQQIKPIVDAVLAKLEEIKNEYGSLNLSKEDIENIIEDLACELLAKLQEEIEQKIADAVGVESFEDIIAAVKKVIAAINEIKNQIPDESEIKAALDAFINKVAAELKAKILAELKAAIDEAIEKSCIDEVIAAVEAAKAKIDALLELIPTCDELKAAVKDYVISVATQIKDCIIAELKAKIDEAIEKSCYDEIVAAIEAAKAKLEALKEMIPDCEDIINAINEIAASSAAKVKAAIEAKIEYIMENYSPEKIKAELAALMAKVEALKDKLEGFDMPVEEIKTAIKNALIKAINKAKDEIRDAAEAVMNSEIYAYIAAETEQLIAEIEAMLADVHLCEETVEEIAAKAYARLAAYTEKMNAYLQEKLNGLTAESVAAKIAETIEAIKAVIEWLPEADLTKEDLLEVAKTVFSAADETVDKAIEKVAALIESVLAHNTIVDEAVAPTCHTTGLTEGSHCVCGHVYVAQEVVPATGKHVWDEGTVTVEPTATKEGEKTYSCTTEGCEASYTEAIPATGVKRVPGDANDSGEFSMADMQLVMKLLSGMDVTINEANADVNASGTVNMADLQLMMKKLSGWDVVLQ